MSQRWMRLLALTIFAILFLNAEANENSREAIKRRRQNLLHSDEAGDDEEDKDKDGDETAGDVNKNKDNMERGGFGGNRPNLAMPAPVLFKINKNHAPDETPGKKYLDRLNQKEEGPYNKTESGSTGSYNDAVHMVQYEMLRFINYLIYEKELYPGDIYGVLIRLAFHDAGTYDKYRGTGGAHACLAIPCGADDGCEYSNKQHRGLPFIIDELNYAYDQNGFYSVLSRADWFHFASFMAVKLSAPYYTDNLYFHWGRTDCPHHDPYYGNMPETDGTTFDYYWSFFSTADLTEIDMLALIGAHTVGRMESRYMGYAGPWVYHTEIFDNEYYWLMWDPYMHWYRQYNVDYFWGPRRSFTSGHDSYIPWRTYLYADMAMYWDISDGYCEIHGYYYECPTNYWYPILELYAHDNYAWMHDFNIAFTKLQNLGLYQDRYGHGIGCIPEGSNSGYDGYGGQGQGDYSSWSMAGGDYGGCDSSGWSGGNTGFGNGGSYGGNSGGSYGGNSGSYGGNNGGYGGNNGGNYGGNSGGYGGNSGSYGGNSGSYGGNSGSYGGNNGGGGSSYSTYSSNTNLGGYGTFGRRLLAELDAQKPSQQVLQAQSIVNDNAAPQV
eukprot:g21083.t1